MNSIALLVITDGRADYIEQTIPSAAAMLKGPITQRVMFDDSGDPAYRQWLREKFPEFTLWYEPERLGCGGAVQMAWKHLRAVDTDYVFHLEDDFLFNEIVPLDEMIEVLETHPYIYQMALRRQPWWQFEIDAGDVINWHAEDYIQKEKWIEHRRYFTQNPSLYRKSLIDLGWLNEAESENKFTQKITGNDSKAQFGLWGQREDKPRVHHIGNLRMGTQY